MRLAREQETRHRGQRTAGHHDFCFNVVEQPSDGQPSNEEGYRKRG